MPQILLPLTEICTFGDISLDGSWDIVLNTWRKWASSAELELFSSSLEERRFVVADIIFLTFVFVFGFE